MTLTKWQEAIFQDGLNNVLLRQNDSVTMKINYKFIISLLLIRRGEIDGRFSWLVESEK